MNWPEHKSGKKCNEQPEEAGTNRTLLFSYKESLDRHIKGRNKKDQPKHGEYNKTPYDLSKREVMEVNFE